MVSTDDEEIALLSKSLGAAVPFLRSEKNSDDFATTAEVIREVLDTYRKNGTSFSQYCCIYPTAPFVSAEKLRMANELISDSNADSVVPVVRFSYPIQRALKIEANKLSMVDSNYINSRSQDLEARYHDAGQFYFGRAKKLLSTGQIFSTNTLPLICTEEEVQDIDTEIDWRLAELKFNSLNF